MAPEQAAEGPVTPAADWYGVGAMLYEALTGRLPFEGSSGLIVAQKQTVAPLAPSALVRDVPADLEKLCVDFLEADPSRRPSGHEVLQRLVLRSERGSEPAPPPASSERPSMLVGRRAEMKVLDAAFSAAQGSAVATLVHGESGIGKTRLVRAFLERAAAGDLGALIFRGQCREREAIPYKAFDEVIDQLTAHLHLMPNRTLEALAPEYIGALLYVFPVLRQVGVFLRLAETETSAHTLDRPELRRRAFLSLRKLLLHLGEQGRAVIVVDDLQWADADSFALLRALLSPPDPPPLLFLATVRTSADAPNEVPRAIVASVPGDVRLLSLGPLPPSSARELAARRVSGERAVDDDLAITIAADANGHPLFIEELARRAAGGRAIGELKLEDALWSRIEELTPSERIVAQLVALSSAALPQETIARAASLHPREFAEFAGKLRAADIIRTSGARMTDGIEPYHDRVREAVLARLADAPRRGLHERLATALEAGTTCDAEALAFHWREAGERDKARRYAATAAEQAWDALAFDRAAEWYAAAIELEPEGEPDRALRVRLGEALGNAGRGSLASAALQSAAEGAEPAEALELQRRAVEQLLRAGRVDEGLAVAERVLALVGMKLPRSAVHALVLLLFWRLVLRWRGFDFVKRDPSLVPALTRMRIDTCGTLGTTLGMSETFAAWLFSTRALVLALEAGDPARIVYPMAAEAAQSASGGPKGRRRAAALLERAAGIARDSGDEKAASWVLALKGYARYAAGEFRDALAIFERAERALLACGAKGYEVSNTQFFLTNTLVIVGRLKESCARVPGLLQEALERDDLLAATSFRTGHSNLVWLVADDPSAARRHLTEAIASWSKRGFHVEHVYALFAAVNVSLYEGDVPEASRLIAENLPLYDRSLLSRLHTIRLRLWQTRARVALARVAAGTGEREEDLRLARRMARLIARERTRLSTPSADLILASVATLEGQRDAAMMLLRAAKADFEAEGLYLDALVASYGLGKLLPGEEGSALTAAATRALTTQTVKRPEAFLRMLGPGLGN
jgi:tetratricopeptide (TPR) repeat protein